MRNGIFGAGNLIVDKIKQLDRWPGEGNLGNIRNEIKSTGGGTANVLFDLAAADPNLPLFAAGLVGDDAEGRFLVSEFKRHKVDTSHIMVHPKLPTSYTDVMSAEGKRTFFQYRGANAELDENMLSDIDVPAKFFYLAYLLLLDKLDSPRADGGTGASHLLRAMRAKGMKTVVDFVSDAPEKFRAVVLPTLPEIDILIVNEIEAAACSSVELRKSDGTMNWRGLPKALDFLFSHGVGDVAVVHFPEGAAGRSRDGKFIFQPSCAIAKSEIVGSNGAGDAFAAGVIYALHEDKPLDEALRLGGAFSRFNLLSPTASDGAVPLQTMLDFLKNCRFSKLDGVAFN